MLLWDAGGCDDGSATRCTCSLALADQLCSEGQKCPVHPNLKDRAHHASPESATLRSLSERLTLVTAVTSILLRHGRKIPKFPPGLHDLFLMGTLVFDSESAAFIYLYYY